MKNSFKDTLSLLTELAFYEVKVKGKETFLGLVWMFLWPVIQSGGFIIAFNLMRGGSLGESVLGIYLGVLIWSTSTMILSSSLSFMSQNIDMIKHLSFPFHLILVNDINIKFFFFTAQFLIGVTAYMLFTPVENIGVVLLGLVLLVCALFMFLVALGWLASLVGAVIADIAVVLPSILMLLLALSPIFHRDQAAQPQALQILNQINPFNWYITTLYGLLDNQAGMIEQALLLLGASALFLLFALLVIKRAYKEIAKLI